MVKTAGEGWQRLPVSTSLHLRNFQWNSLPEVQCLYIAGALTDTVLELLQKESVLKNADLLVRDFTKIFISPLQYRLFVKRGRQIRVLQQTKLIAICVNPVAPNGIVLHSEQLCQKMAQAVQVPVYDLCKHGE